MMTVSEQPRRDQQGSGPWRGVDLSPSSAYEVVTRQMVEGMKADLAEIKGRINNLMVMVAGAVLVNIILRLAGFG